MLVAFAKYVQTALHFEIDHFLIEFFYWSANFDQLKVNAYKQRLFCISANPYSNMLQGENDHDNTRKQAHALLSKQFFFFLFIFYLKEKNVFFAKVFKM